MFASVVSFAEPSSVGSGALVDVIMSDDGIMVVSFFMAMGLALSSICATAEQPVAEAPTRAAFIQSSGSMFGLPI